MVRPTILQLIIIGGLLTLVWSGSKLVGSQLSQVSPDVSLTSTSSPSLPATTPTPSPSAAPTSTVEPFPTFSPQPSSAKPVQTKLKINQWRYPNADQISATSSTLKSESSDSADQITSWYERKITSFGMSAKSFVKTNTNGQVLNKLVASGSLGKMEVEISQQEPSSKVIITVTVNL